MTDQSPTTENLKALAEVFAVSFADNPDLATSVFTDSDDVCQYSIYVEVSDADCPDSPLAILLIERRAHAPSISLQFAVTDPFGRVLFELPPVKTGPTEVDLRERAWIKEIQASIAPAADASRGSFSTTRKRINDTKALRARAASSSFSHLLDEMRLDPCAFEWAGGIDEVVRAVQHGASPLELRPDLLSDDINNLLNVTWIASELGTLAQPIVDDVLPLALHENLQIAMQSLEVVGVCFVPTSLSHIRLILGALCAPQQGLRLCAMKLIGNQDDEALLKIAQTLEQAKFSESDAPHFSSERVRGLVKCPEPHRLLGRLLANAEIEQRYAALAIRRHLGPESKGYRAALRQARGDARIYLGEEAQG